MRVDRFQPVDDKIASITGAPIDSYEQMVDGFDIWAAQSVQPEEW